jgi:glycosyltransferase involved in cell wall biosynthesis
MRLLYFTDNNSDHNRRFLDKLAVSGHEVFYLSLAGAPYPSFWLPRGIHLVESESTFPRHASPSDIEDFLPELKKILGSLKPDLVQAGPIQSCAYLTSRAKFHPMLAMSWGSDILVDSQRGDKWFEATRIALAGADGFFCDCDAVLRCARQISTIPLERVVQFPWGLHPGVFSPSGERMQLPFYDHEFVFICTRSWEELYGIDVVLRAFEIASSQSAHLKLLLIGHGSLEAEVLSFVEEHDLEERVLIPGSVSGADMPRYLRAADAYISCARSDGTSVSLLEAMATGLPVIVADNASNREWVAEGKNGWLCKIGSVEEFAATMLLVAEQSRASRADMSARNQQIVAERANWDKNFPLLLNSYENILSFSRASR